MIIVSYVYEYEVIGRYQRGGNENRDIVLPRQDELVDIDDELYRVETVTHMFRRNANCNTKQHIIIKLTKQLTT